MTTDTSDWASLKDGWRHAPPEVAALGARLDTSLRVRIWASRLWFASELFSFALLLVIIVQKFAVGERFAGGFLAAVALLCIGGWWWARRGRRVGSHGSLVDMIDTSLSRARQGLRMVYASYVVIALMFVPTFVEAQPPVLEDDRFVARLLWLTLSAGVAVGFHLVTLARRERYTALQRVYGASVSAAAR
jgi:hypothetical protein